MSHLNKIILLIVTLLTLSCGVNYSKMGGEGGSLSLTIPSISPTIKNQFKAGKGSERAFVLSSSVKLSIYDDQNTIVDTLYYESGEDVNIVLSQGLYTLQLEVFNHYMSTDVPVVQGISEEFEIIPGQITYTHIMLTPTEPINLEESYEHNINVSDFSEYNLAFNSLEEIKSEYWFSFTATSNVTLIESSRNEEEFRSSIIFVYNSFGEFLNSTSIMSDLVFETIAGEEYYAVVLPYYYHSNYQDSHYPTNVSVCWSEYDIADTDNSFETATEVVLDGTTTSNTLYDGDSDFFSVTVTAGNFYNIIKESSQDLILTIYNSSFEIINQLTMANNSVIISHHEDDILFVEVTDNVSGINNYTLSFVEKITEAITPSNEWQVYNVVYKESEFYSLAVTSGSTYSLSWDSSWEGSGEYSADVVVSVYDQNGITLKP